MTPGSDERTPLSWLDRAHIALGSVSGGLIIAMIVLVAVDVAIRKLFAVTVPGASEMNVLLLVALVYLGLAGAQARGAHFAVDVVVDRLPAPLRRAVSALTTLASLAFAGTLTWFTSGKAVDSYLAGEASFGVVAFPIWPSRAAITLGLGLLTLQLAVQLLRILAGRPVHPHGRQGASE